MNLSRAGWLIALALATTLALGPGLDGAAAADGAECTWQRHAKRVVKRVKRNGKVRRVARKRVWWTCEPVAAAQPVSPVLYDKGGLPPPEPDPNRLSVKAAEFFLVLSRPSVAAGEVTVELNNYGEDPHDLNLQRQDSEDPAFEIAETEPQERTSGEFDLAAGSYRLWCSLPEHDELGMHATLLVE